MGIRFHIAEIAIGMILLFLFKGSLSGQESPFEPSMRDKASRITERAVCFTDRSLYIAGEKIRFRCSVGLSGATVETAWSSILYVELITPSGHRKVAGKYPLKGKVASGEIRISDDVRTGDYYLRCYTRWMRNFGPESYAYTPVKVIHPYLKGLVPEGDPGNLTRQLEEIPLSDGGLQIQAPSVICGREDSIVLEFSARGPETAGRPEGCLTVVAIPAKPFPPLRIPEETGHKGEDFRVELLPDLKGMALTGNTVPGSTVHITLLGSHSEYLVIKAGPSGRFHGILPMMKGTVELLVQGRGPDGTSQEVRIDQDFDLRSISLSADPFKLSESESGVALRMARNLQLEEMIHTSGAPRKKKVSRPDPFYGRASVSVDLDLYVDLPTLREVFVNLVPGVFPVWSGEKPELVIRGDNPLLSFYDPLVMVDLVPFFNLEQLMAISPGKIRRIDVVDDVYVKGDRIYGGIINLQSRDGDVAGIPLPPHAFFIDLQGLHPTAGERDNVIFVGEPLPDTRNTVHWISQLRPEGKITFVIPGHPGCYAAVFRGLDVDGRMVVAETVFRIQ